MTTQNENEAQMENVHGLPDDRCNLGDELLKSLVAERDRLEPLIIQLDIALAFKQRRLAAIRVLIEQTEMENIDEKPDEKAI